MRTHPLTGSIAAFVMLASAPLGSAAADLAPLTAAELHEKCTAYIEAPQSTVGLSCASYIRGFIEGSTEVQFRLREVGESFSDRALRTRLGLPRDARPLYCLDGSLSMREFISNLIMYLGQLSPHESLNASAVLYGTLRRYYRCNR